MDAVAERSRILFVESLPDPGPEIRRQL